MKILNEQKFGVPTESFAVGATSAGYTLEYSADGVNWTSLDKSTPANEVHLISGCPKNVFWRLKNNVGEALIQW